MQYGSVTREERKHGLDVWSYRWWEPGPNRKRVHRRLIIGSVTKFKGESSALKAIAGLRMEINSTRGMRPNAMSVAQLAEHYRQRELKPNDSWRSYATKYAYEGYLQKWIVPRWGEYSLESVRTIEVESWLFSRNPIELVRQSAKRRKIPEILTVEEVHQLLKGLEPRERTLVLSALCTGLRKSELFALQWQDIDFDNRQIRVNRSIVCQVVGFCKTEASKKPVPLHFLLAEVLQKWNHQTRYRAPSDWVFASPHARSRTTGRP